ncbi:MAG: hypothetical protein MUF06_12830 [Pirellulaceae bacterium]|nr:hypothetical protein [Pirellulaceae bacterium]
MSVGNLLRSSYLYYFSQPASDRTLFKAMKGRPIRSIVEIGVSLGGRTERLLEVAAWQPQSLPLQYTGIDLFDSRPVGQPKLSLKQAFHDLRATGATIRLVPGDPLAALSRTANALSGTDLLLVSGPQDTHSLAAAWKYVPRMIHPETLVFVEQSSESAKNPAWRLLAGAEITRLAAAAGRALRQAA